MQGVHTLPARRSYDLPAEGDLRIDFAAATDEAAGSGGAPVRP